MNSFIKSLVQLIQAEDGPTAVEYAVMLALILIVIISAVMLVGQATSTHFNNVALQGLS